jgi:uncharacterized membrane protein
VRRLEEAKVMLGRIRLALLLAASLAMALIAGFFYAYDCSVMLGLAQLDAEGFVRTMQAINATVRNPYFAFSFFGALALTVATVLLYLPSWRAPAAKLVILALVAYAIGGFGVTMAINVPMNNALAGVDPAGASDLGAARRAYEGPWVSWNRVRTAASTAAFALLLGAVYAEGRRSAGAPQASRKVEA